VAVDFVKHDADTATFRGKGTNDAGEQTVAVQFTLHGYALAGRGPAGAEVDRKLIEHWKARWAVLTGELKSRQETRDRRQET
jgi:3-hydroxyacyl-[acyl-carrier-protein] dehydratase